MSLAELGWRQFTFFDKTNVQDPNHPSEKFSSLKNLSAMCSVSGDGFALFGEKGGAMLKLSHKLDQYFWVAHKFSMIDMSVAGNILATVGEDEEGINSLVKIWQLDRIEKDAPFCLRVIRVCQILASSQGTQACCVALHSSHQHIAVGFRDSSVIYHAGNLLKDKLGKWLTIPTNAGDDNDGEITALAIAWLPVHGATVLFCATRSSVKSFAISNKAVVNTVVHDAKGCSRYSWSFSEATNRFTVGSVEMVYFYDADQSLALDPDGGKGRCHALGRSNEKIQLLTLNNYVILLTRQPSAVTSADDEWNYVVSVYDIENQCVAFSCALPSVSRVFLLDSNIMILSQDGTLSTLQEKHITVKLDILFKKNLFDLAVRLAKRSHLDAESLSDIYRKYGDYLFSNGDFENAVQQYSETVGFLEPSYVIKKFLEGSRTKELSSYLEALHAVGKANAHHTTILLNCYTKMEAVDKIDQFISRNVECDVDVAVQVLRSAGFSKEACRLCEKHKLHDAMLAILIEELCGYEEALLYIGKLEIDEVEKYMGKYGKVLLEHCSEKSMELLMNLVSSNAQVDSGQLLKMFVGDQFHCSQFIKAALEKNKEDSNLKNTNLEIRLRQLQSHDEILPEDHASLLELIDTNNLKSSLHLCQMFGFTPGIVYIYEKLEKYDELLEYYMQRKDFDEIIQLCERLDNQKMWMEAIVYISNQPDIDRETVHYMLERVEASSCLHPLVVLEVLSQGEHLHFVDVRDYIVKWLTEQTDHMQSDEEAITASEEKMNTVEEQIESLNYRVQLFQLNKCSVCDTSLQLPTVHFLCRHSYHAHCLESYSEKADYCPACRQSTVRKETAKEIRTFVDNRSACKQFQKQMDTAIDCMSLVSEYVAQGLFMSSLSNIPDTSSTLRATKKLNGSDSRDRESSFPSNKSQTSGNALLIQSSNPFLEESSDPFTRGSSSSLYTFNDSSMPANPFDSDF
ncbi:hypothetical protein AB6A40_003548 [Gnathostoma spinigerum]|uniref:Vacuolar protein sorting-associated protein 11 homolog n=1 Tax=Gnathostoma spinigerum TaxID=75299 RepID=A0ABD6EFF3_9BILA